MSVYNFKSYFIHPKQNQERRINTPLQRPIKTPLNQLPNLNIKAAYLLSYIIYFLNFFNNYPSQHHA
ncbi:hypothetical protein FGO68_gene4057 [Halteria grandinella]|uniref:Uncharacterized protein n=1 Tax=Halteria grandinella TaxID=5974 RepID=A0A8J8SVE3_HALGN|nr:hypothetical protein FGO68_gene4057 [Halteria grandinella]